MPAAETYRYDAFISYRHVEPDRSWAKWLHRALETFKTPKPLVRKGVPARIRRVFRDEEELPASADLSQEIAKALEQSRFLIMVCSPRTPRSEWVNQEVVRFRELGRHDRILALLIEGEPAESFPQALREIRTQITDEDGTVTEQIEDVEPLAADVRVSRDESPRFLKRMALLRFSAALLGCRFDDLRRREAERRKRRVALAGMALFVVAAVLAGLLVFAIQERNAKAEALDEKARALDDVERLADSKTVRDLVQSADDLWPLHPDTEPAMAAWIARTEKVLEHRPLHEAVLATLSERAAPYADEDRERDHAGHRERLASLRKELAAGSVEHAKLHAEGETAAVACRVMGLALEKLKADIVDVEALLKTRITWHFEDPRNEWKHHVLTELLADMERLDSAIKKRGLLRTVQQRRAFVTALRKRLVDDASLWQQTNDAIAASAPYEGLFEIAPQIGLVPLGPDPDSGLLEFGHVGSGSIPTRDPRTKHLVLAEDAAIVLVLIPGGTFFMGAQKTDTTGQNYDPGADPDATAGVAGNENPVHQVTLSPYLFGKYETTQAQWAALSGGETPSNYVAGDTVLGQKLTQRNPVENISWEACDRWLTRHGLEFPTEAQWEYACRSGTDGPWFTGEDLSKLVRAANVADRHLKENGGPKTWAYDAAVSDGFGIHAPVGSFAANPFGLFDVHGNVGEWCRDTYRRYEAGAAVDPVAVGPGSRLYRGGGWLLTSSDARSARRLELEPRGRIGYIGVRAGRAIIR